MRKRNPKTALVLSAIFPGLGQLYNGDIWKGVGFLALGFVLGWMSTEAISLDELLGGELPSGTARFIGVSLLFLACYFFSMVEAYRSAKRTTGTRSKP